MLYASPLRPRPRWSRPLGLLAAVALATATLGPVLDPAALRRAVDALAPLWQAPSFEALVPLLATGLAWLALGWQSRRRVEERLHARLAERERIARELHDHLLQGAINLILRVDASVHGLPPEHPTRRQIEAALDYADDVLKTTRAQVLQLRSHQPRGELALALEEAIAQRRPVGAGAAAVDVVVVGRPRPLAEACWAELYGIALEAATNALRHARAARVVVTLDYRDDTLMLTVSDDGIGIPAEILRRGGRAGHWGLRSMHERAELLGVRLDLRAPAAGGTVVAVDTPARVAYGAPVGRGRPRPH
jgi:signal transduction histidine kinase